MEEIQIAYEVWGKIRLLAKRRERSFEGTRKSQLNSSLSFIVGAWVLVGIFMALFFYGDHMDGGGPYLNHSSLFWWTESLLVFVVLSFSALISWQAWPIFKDNRGSERTSEEQSLLADPVAQLAYEVVQAEKTITAFIKSWNSYVRRRDLGILRVDPELEVMGPVAQKAHDTLEHLLRMTYELVTMREERLTQDEKITELNLAKDINITETLETLSAAASRAMAYVQAYQEVEGQSISCPLEAIAKIEKIQAELRGDLPESQKINLARRAAERQGTLA